MPVRISRVTTSEQGGSLIAPVAPEDVSHADIYRALGVLEGKLDALGQALTQRNLDFTTALNRITELEKTVAKGLGIALACSVVIPLLVGSVSQKVHLGHPPAAGTQQVK
jgi:hypothetical protein